MSAASQTVLIIDDDEVSREVIMLLVEEAGYPAAAAESGDEALTMLCLMEGKPWAVLADLQMPGITGGALAQQLREVCGDTARLLLMSGSAAEEARGFDGFLLKPFAAADLRRALAGSHEGTGTEGDAPEALEEGTLQSLSRSMPAEPLRRLYRMCLDDGERRIGIMREAWAAGDRDRYAQAAHAIKGGCGMVGAVELATLAGELEERALLDDRDLEAPGRMAAAWTRLRLVLNAAFEGNR